MAKRNKKGSVAVHNRNGMLRLRWRYLGREYSLAMGLPDTVINRAVAEKLAATIQIDIALGEFDPSLSKYRSKPTKPATGNTLELFAQFLEYKESEGIQKQSINSCYKPLRKYLELANKSLTTGQHAETVMQAISKRRNPRNYNQALIRLKSFGNWCVDNGHWPHNPFAEIKPKKIKKRIFNVDRNPFTEDEVKRLLDTIANTSKLKHYYPFTLCLFALGLRPSEAIGLRWKYVDLERKQITIAEVLVRNDGAQPLRKGTKNDVVRQLDLVDVVVTVLKSIKPIAVNPDALVFTSPKGKPLEANAYRACCWKQALQAANIPYRPPYTARHTFISWGIEKNGWSLPQAAALAGNSVPVMASTYAHMVDKPPMPEIKR